jgi:hypothetical protein
MFVESADAAGMMRRRLNIVNGYAGEQGGGMKREVTLRTSLSGNFRLIVVEERFDQRTGERYFVDENGSEWRLDNALDF